MLRGAFTIAVISGVPVRVHWTFLILLAWVFGAGALGGSIWSALQSLAFVLAVFACVVAHEFGHILAARAFGIGTRDVLLLPIGGVASLQRMPEQPWQELVVAVAGPAVNVLIAGVLLPVILLLPRAPSSPADLLANPAAFTSNFLAALAGVNVWLVLFNLIPAFPMDGGRVLRALLAMMLGPIPATRAAARVGQVLAALMALFGIVFGLPMLLILALFVFLAAGAEASGTEASELLRGVPVSEVMLTRFRVLAQHDTLRVAVEELLARSQADFPVTVDGTTSSPVVGLLTRADLVRALAEAGPDSPVGAAMRASCPPVAPRDAALGALDQLRAGACPVIPVLERGVIVGLVTAENVSEAIMVRGALRSGGQQTTAPPARPAPPGPGPRPLP